MATAQGPFEEAVAQLQSMFEGVDRDIIESVLKANNNDVSAACDSLLEITGAAPTKPSAPANTVPAEETDEEMALRLQMEEDAAIHQQQQRQQAAAEEPDFIDQTIDTITTSVSGLKEAAAAKWNSLVSSFNSDNKQEEAATPGLHKTSSLPGVDSDTAHQELEASLNRAPPVGRTGGMQ